MRRSSLAWQVFLSALTVALVSILTTGVIARRALAAAFNLYLEAAAAHMGTGMGRGMGRMLMGAAEHSFLRGVDRGIVISAIVAVVLAALVAFGLAAQLARPLRALTAGAQALARGDLEHRVEVRGPLEIEALAHAFNDMASSLEASERLRRRLVSDVAHELRNPIAALRAQAEAMAEGVLPMDHERIASMVEDLTGLSRLVADLQELSTAEAGGLRYERERFDLAELVAREVERAALVASDEQRVSIAGVLQVVPVEADALRITQVIRNLLDNALRHTPRGAIEVLVEPIDGWARVSVRDTGEGIPPEDLPYIFERFYRVDASRANRTGGTGLGLAISRRIVEDHGGQVFATSTVGVGSIIGFTLPLAAQSS